MKGRAERLPGMAQLPAGLGWPVRVITPGELRDEPRALGDRLREWAVSGEAGEAG